jgi:hypothetical protein
VDAKNNNKKSDERANAVTKLKDGGKYSSILDEKKIILREQKVFSSD